MKSIIPSLNAAPGGVGPLANEDTMKFKQMFAAMAAALLILSSGAANAGETINEAGTTACATDKWNELSLRRDTSWSTSLADASASTTIPPYRVAHMTAWESTSTCLMGAGRAAELALAPTKVETS